MKKLLALLLALVMLMSFAACGGTENNSTEAPTEAPTEPDPTDAPTEPEITDYKMVDSFYMYIDGHSLNAMDNGDGTVYIDMTTDELIKRGTVDTSAWDAISKALAGTDYAELEELYDGDYSHEATLSVGFGEEGYFTSSCYTEIPAEFTAVYDAMLTCFKEITKDLEEYIPVPMENGEIADSDKAALNAILANLDLGVPADSFAMNGIVKDEYFANSMGLSSDSGVVSGLSFVPMMTSVAYSLNIVTLEDAANANTVAADFENNVDWTKWLCVQPGTAYIAVKDNQVLCLMGSDEIYTSTVAAIEAAGWTAYATVDNPDM